VCHGEHGEGRSALVTFAGPSLRAEHNTGDVMTAVEVGPSHMPSFVYILSIPEMHAVSQYVVERVADIPLGAGDLGKGGELFRRYCASCHRTAGRGGALAYDGINAPDLTGKSAALIAGAIRWGPGPMPAFPPSVLDDKALSSIVTYVRYSEHPDRPGGLSLSWYGPVPEGGVAWLVVFGLIGATVWIEKGGKG
jgi:ubiquinol-cytochrome c reductase cytochrome c subunit